MMTAGRAWAALRRRWVSMNHNVSYCLVLYCLVYIYLSFRSLKNDMPLILSHVIFMIL